MIAGPIVPAAASAAPVTAGFRDLSYGTTVTAPTGQKPEGKLWFNDGGLVGGAVQRGHEAL